jgi:predicted small secreted protein
MIPRLHSPRSARTLPSILLASLLAASALTLPGCNWAGFLADVTAGGKEAPIKAARYQGLKDKKVAVFVSADEALLRAYPQAPLSVCQSVTGAVKAAVPTAKVMNPSKINDFQIENPYWNTFKNSDLIKRLDVDRIVYIDLIEYATHEPGNASVWRGSVVANVQVISRDAANPDNYVYTDTVKALYPSASKVGVINSSDAAIQAGMLNAFSAAVGYRFSDPEND